MWWLVPALAVLTALILILLVILPLSVSFAYNEDGLRLRVGAGPVKLTLFPAKKKVRKKGKPEEKKISLPKKKAPKPTQQKKEKGGSLTDFIPLVKIALEYLNGLRRKLRVNRLELKLVLAGDDPCDLALNYGRAQAAVDSVMPQLERFLVIKKRSVDMECDFTAEQTLVIARVDISVTLGRLVGTSVYYALRALTAYLKIHKLRKGGAAK